MARLLAPLIVALVALVGRWKVRWFRWRRLPLVRDALAQGLPPAPAARVTALLPPALPLGAPDDSPDYLSVPDSRRLVAGQPAALFRVASTRILPAPPLELAVFRPDRWDITAKRRVASAGFTTPRPGELAQARAPADRPALVDSALRTAPFGLDDTASTTRLDRNPSGIRVDGNLSRLRPARLRTLRLRPVRSLGIVDPARAFGLAPDGTPAAEAVPVERRHPPRLTRARASFVAKYVDPVGAERLLRDYPTTFGEEIASGVAGFFVASAIGARSEKFEWSIADEMEEQLKEVREQFGLRRDLDRVEFENDDLGRLEPDTKQDLQSIFEFTGLEFVDFQPEPVPTLRMELEKPPMDLAPTVEHHEDALRFLASALAEFQLGPDGPPVPDVP